ncbi:MAG: hypothetical protein CMA37_00985 [Euryarchaeota archaeon]|nr:hypothetical protein [Euryarchaeota archaeon]|tara:strand:+ start:114 stop:590 length:477 start_codon:yes stop_codon:yes gene_type:complete
MKMLGELPSLIVALETDFRGHCLKCKGRRGIRNEVYKPYRDRQVLEKGKCIQCGSTMRNFRKAVFYSKNSYRGMDQKLAGKIEYPRMEFIDLNKLLGKETARIISRRTKYHPLRSLNLAVESLDLDPSTVSRYIINARNAPKSSSSHKNLLKIRGVAK